MCDEHPILYFSRLYIFFRHHQRQSKRRKNLIKMKPKFNIFALTSISFPPSHMGEHQAGGKLNWLQLWTTIVNNFTAASYTTSTVGNKRWLTQKLIAAFFRLKLQFSISGSGRVDKFHSIGFGEFYLVDF